MGRTFPDYFLFGSATSAHQVEGGNIHNDWWAFEHSPERLAKLKHLGLEPAQFISGRACDHWNRYEEDFDLAQHMHHGAHRFSIEWSRIEPEEGRWNEEAIAHYRDVIAALRKRNIEPMVTLHHFTNPLWFSQRGGWLKRDAPIIFARYVRRLVATIGDRVTWWITINEPSVLIAKGYLAGTWPPQRRNPFFALRAFRNLAEAHRLVTRDIKSRFRHAHIGIASNVAAWIAERNTAGDQWAARVAKAISWQRLLHGIRDHVDFIGVNYYVTNRVRLSLSHPIMRGCGSQMKSDLGVDICPDGLDAVLHDLWSSYRKPLLVTENGLADADDSRRPRFLLDHLAVIEKALRDGIDIRGYLHWSLLDNFEWADGFSPRFGLIAIDYQTMKRTPRPSARLFAEICRTKMLPEKL